MMDRTTIVLCTLFAGCWACAAALAEERPPRTITYDSHWVLHELDAGFDLRDERESSRRRVRDDGTRDDDRDFVGINLHFQLEFGELLPTTLGFHVAHTPAPTERSRNWILPTLDDGLTARDGDEPEVDTGWGWLMDAVETGRQQAEARTRETATTDQAEEEMLSRLRATDQAQSELLSTLGAMNGAEPVLQNLADQRQLDDDLLNRMANMNPDEIRDFIDAQQDAMGANALLSGGTDEPRGFTAQAAEGSLFGDGARLWGSSALSGDSLFASDWGGSFATTESLAPPRATTGPDRFGGVGQPGGAGLVGSRAGDGGFAGFEPTPVSGGGWSADWSGDSAWETDTFRSETVTTPTTPPGTAGGGLERFSVQGSGWLADR